VQERDERKGESHRGRVGGRLRPRRRKEAVATFLPRGGNARRCYWRDPGGKSSTGGRSGWPPRMRPLFRARKGATVDCLYLPGLGAGPSWRRASPELAGWHRDKAGPSAWSAVSPAETRWNSTGTAAAKDALVFAVVVATGQPVEQNRARSTASNTLPRRRRTGPETTVDRRDRPVSHEARPQGDPTGADLGIQGEALP
jgi:hypothetical protein